MKTYMVVYFGAAFIAVFATPVICRVARRLGLVDKPEARKVHRTPVPRIGGIVFVLATFAVIVPVFILDNAIGNAFRKVHGQVLFLLGASVIVFAVGFVDDLVSVRSSVKLLCLVLAALGVACTGARLQEIGLGAWGRLELGWISWPVTVLWIVGITVGINFIDGLDGLAAGVAVIVCGTIAAFAYFSDQIAMAVLMLALLGSLTGFLFFNFNPAKIFMGDGGSMFLGFVIAAGSVVCQAKNATLVGIAAPALALGVPLFDAAFTMIRRGILDRRSVFVAERGHIHHRLLDKGLSHRSAVFLIYGTTLAAGAAGALMLVLRGGLQLALLVGGMVFLFLVFHFAGTARIGETLKALLQRRDLARRLREERSHFEDVQLMIRQARTFEAWWQAVCAMAERMEFERVAVWTKNGSEGHTTVVWRRSDEELSAGEVVSVTLPVSRDGARTDSKLEISARPNGCLESVGRRVSLMGRLIDERALPESRQVAPAPAPARREAAVSQALSPREHGGLLGGASRPLPSSG